MKINDKELQDGDIFAWVYKESLGNQTDLYWCKSKFCIFKNDKLEDTYWHGSDNLKFTTNIDKFNFKFLGNFNELEEIERYRGTYYHDSDLVDISHANNSRQNLYLRKCSVESTELMRYNLLKKKSYINKKLISLQQDLDRVTDVLDIRMVTSKTIIMKMII